MRYTDQDLVLHPRGEQGVLPHAGRCAGSEGSARLALQAAGRIPAAGEFQRGNQDDRRLRHHEPHPVHGGEVAAGCGREGVTKRREEKQVGHEGQEQTRRRGAFGEDVHGGCGDEQAGHCVSRDDHVQCGGALGGQVHPVSLQDSAEHCEDYSVTNKDRGNAVREHIQERVLLALVQGAQEGPGAVPGERRH